VGDVTLIDHALDRLFAVCDRVAVNVHAHADEVIAHLRGHGRRSEATRPEVRISRESPEALGTAGALAQLADWIDGSAVLAVNADTYTTASLAAVVEAWDGESVLVAHTGTRFKPGVGVVASITPASAVASLSAVPSGLYQTLWKPLSERGALQTVAVSGCFIDCGTPFDLWRANMEVSGGESVLGEGAVVLGEIRRSVVFPRAVVNPGERLDQAIRLASGRTVWVR
jgi:NDP-sugar pyrophosphorylase family protein